MAKFTDPTGNGAIYLTQNYHGEKTTAVDTQCAIDIRMKKNEYFHSVCDGTVELTTTSSNGYISIIPTGMSARVLYVHTDRYLVKKGDSVKAGQKLGQIQDITGCHLHLGMKNKDNSKNPPQIMDYFDRSLNFKTDYADITKDWFVNGKLNWSLFKDLSYGAVESPEDPQITELKKQVADLNKSIDSYKASIISLQAQIDSLAKEKKDLTINVTSLKIEIDEGKKSLIELQGKYDSLYIEKNRLENEKNEAIAQLNSSNGLSGASTGELIAEIWKRILKLK